MAEILRLRVDRMETPLGALLVIVDEEGRLRATTWEEHEAHLPHRLGLLYGAQGFTLEPERNPGGVTSAISAYFQGELGAIDGLPVETAGTPFQRAVWSALRGIPCGTTQSYGELAHRIGRPSAVRAVGLANGANPVGIVVPCHRVIGSNGSLTGFAGGLERKRWLLAHESAARPGHPTSQLSLPLSHLKDTP
jgi:methylated-DNA-[protein]-cysteine S-methyltransferase